MRTHASWKVTRNVDIFSCRENVRVQNPPVGAASLGARGARRGSWGQGLGVCCVSWHSGLASRAPASDGRGTAPADSPGISGSGDSVGAGFRVAVA